MERRGTRKASPLTKLPEICSDRSFAGYSRISWIAAKAKANPEEAMHALMHHFSVANLRQAFRELSGSKASGIDGVTKQKYAEELLSNLEALIKEIKGGGFRPRPSREVLIPKANGETRPIAIGCLEDKIVQTLVARILEAVFDPIFYTQSYGFRRNKSAHQALSRLYQEIMRRKASCVVVEIDIEKFFNSMDQKWLIEKLSQRITDPKFLRLVRRLLRNSVLHQDGRILPTLLGTPQGSPVSPILANIYLHFLLDEWFTTNHSKTGEFIRFADDAVFLFKSLEQAQTFFSALKERMKEGALSLNDSKSGIVPFSCKKPQGFVSFLGFELYWGRTRAGTHRTLKMKTARKKLNQAMKEFSDWIKKRRNRDRTKKLWDTAKAKLRGHFNYFGVTFNQAKLSHFYWVAIQNMYKWLNRRSQKRSITWEKFKQKLWNDPLPKPPLGFELIDLFSKSRAVKHFSKSRMRENRTSGSDRSAGQQCPAFT